MRKLARRTRRKKVKTCVICQQPFEAVREDAMCCTRRACRAEFSRLRAAQAKD